MPFPLIPIITSGIGALAGIGKAKGEARQEKTEQILSQDASRQRLYEVLTDALLRRGSLGARRAEFELGAPAERFRQGIRGNLAANLQDVGAQVPRLLQGQMVNFTGGLRPSALGPGGRALGSQLAALAAERMGKDTFELPTLPPPPTPSQLPGRGFLESFGAYADPVLGALGSKNLLDILFKKKPKPGEGPFENPEDDPGFPN